MGILECDKEGACKCIGPSVIRCAKAMKIVQKQSSGAEPIESPTRIRIFGETMVRPGDQIRIGLRTFSAFDDDTVLRELNDGRVHVTVLRNDQIIMQGVRGRDSVKFVPADGSGSINFVASLAEEEDGVNIDIQDMRDQGLL